MYAKIIIDMMEGGAEERYFPISESNRCLSKLGVRPLLRLHKIGGDIQIVEQDMNRDGIVVYIENDTGATLQVYRGAREPRATPDPSDRLEEPPDQHPDGDIR